MIALLAVVVPVWADNWYEHYARAESALEAGDPRAAIAELNQALERRGDSGTRVRTYGMRVIDYFPYLKLGIAYYLAGEPEAALRAFETAERLGAVKASERASSELELYRQQATDAVERQQTEQQRAVDDLIDLNLAEARNFRGAGRLEEALAAVDRALALAPENPDATGLSGALREELIRRENERIRRERVSELISEGQRLRADGRLTEAAGRFRQAVELAPDSTAAELLAEVQTELAVESDVGPAYDPSGSLAEADELFSRGQFDDALALVQEVLAAAPGNARAIDLENDLLARIADENQTAEIDRLFGEAQAKLGDGDSEGAIASANLVLARNRGHAGAIEVIRQAYSSLSRRLLGEGPAQNLPPAIRFADQREERPDGELIHVVRDPDFLLTGVVIDDSAVTLSAGVDAGRLETPDLSSQQVGGVTITEFRLEVGLDAGVTNVEVVATDSGGLSSRSGYTVEYRRPLMRSPWLWWTAIALTLLLFVVAAIRRILRRRRLLRRRFNPFIAGPPVLDPNLFVGRDALVDRVLATVPNNSLLLLGERRIGKTSILQQLRPKLAELDHSIFCFVPVSVDLQGVPEEAFFSTVAEAVGEAIGDDRMTAARDSAEYDSRQLMRDLRRVLPTVECRDGRRAKVVLLLDEIDELNGYSHRTNQRLRSLFMRGFADQLVAVAAGVGIAREWDHEGSPWYNFFEEIEVGPVEAAAARALVTEPLGGVINVDEEAVDRMIQEADGRPYIVQKIALAVVQHIHETGRSRITVDDVETVIRPKT